MTIIVFDPFYVHPDAITVMPGQQVIVVKDGHLKHDLNVEE